MTSPEISELVSRTISPELHHEIKRLWQIHSIAEDKRDLDGLISTLTNDCVYELANNGVRWEGHDGARRFYTELLAAFPDIHFALANIVIGPQGVFEEASVTATHLGTWQGRSATGRNLSFRVLILFPWDNGERKFKGERVWFDVENKFGLHSS